MGKWSDLDGDDHRLPEGMTRVGYDADTQVYTYRDSDGSHWEGAPGSRYGRLHRVTSAARPLPRARIPAFHSTVDKRPFRLNILHDHGQKNDQNDSIPASPDKAKLPNPNPLPHHSSPAPGTAKTLADLPSSPTKADTNADPDSTSLLSGTTVRDSFVSDNTRPESDNNFPRLGRTGTLSRLARFLTSSSSPGSTSNSRASVSRRATFNGDASGESGDGGGERHGTNARVARSSTLTRAEGTGMARMGARWPGTSARAGAGEGAGAGRDEGNEMPMVRRATTFDEILGVEPRK
ncbi:hypothetical protein N658DRAFT_498841 [Parathielavia hyrcaniae]|uniref:Carbohydrate-binding module family 50 protein n=1 Tax=Parathielavia hyrcaniae TaxID=113614 RepID=A0AAN6SZC4_9PEZI|nr:hypothetical protein N658DRAFT_498841 [Parathielavia hyrcaniae]